MVDTVIRYFCTACWVTPLAYGSSIFVRAYFAERREGRNPTVVNWNKVWPRGRNEVIV